MMEIVLTFGLCTAIMAYVETVGLGTWGMKYILMIGLRWHRSYIQKLINILVFVDGMLVEEEWEWKRFQPHGNPGEGSAAPKLICRSCRQMPVHFNLVTGFIYVDLS